MLSEDVVVAKVLKSFMATKKATPMNCLQRESVHKKENWIRTLSQEL